MFVPFLFLFETKLTVCFKNCMLCVIHSKVLFLFITTYIVVFLFVKLM